MVANNYGVYNRALRSPQRNREILNPAYRVAKMASIKVVRANDGFK
jgi:hypothetical protein